MSDEFYDRSEHGLDLPVTDISLGPSRVEIFFFGMVMSGIMIAAGYCIGYSMAHRSVEAVRAEQQVIRVQNENMLLKRRLDGFFGGRE